MTKSSPKSSRLPAGVCILPRRRQLALFVGRRFLRLCLGAPTGCGLLALREDLGDTDHREFLAMAALAAGILPPPFLERDDLRATALIDDLAGNASAVHGRRAHLKVVAAEHQHVAELDDLARLALDLVDGDDVVGR